MDDWVLDLRKGEKNTEGISSKQPEELENQQRKENRHTQRK